MARTIGPRWPRSAPSGDYAATCDRCQARYQRSKMLRSASGLLVCRGPGTNDCAREREAVTLDQLNHARRRRPAARAHRGGLLDGLPPLLAQKTTVFPAAFYCRGERVSSTYTGAILQLGLQRVTEGPEVIDATALTDIGYTEGTNLVATEEELAACGSNAGYCRVLYDQCGDYDVSQTGSSLGLYPQVWRKTYQQFVGEGALPLLGFTAGSALARADACGLTGDCAFTLFIVASGLGEVLGIGGTGDRDGIAVRLVDDDSADDHGELLLDYNSDLVRFVAPRWHTMPGRETEIYAITIRRSAGAALNEVRVRIDGQDLTPTAMESEITGSFSMSPTAFSLGPRAGGEAFTGVTYAAGVYSSALSDDDVDALETWAIQAYGRMNDHRGAFVGSKRP